jgi:hypothetical protein
MSRSSQTRVMKINGQDVFMNKIDMEIELERIKKLLEVIE